MLRELDEQEWGELGKALVQSFKQVDEGGVPAGPPNAEYCWQGGEPGHTGGWLCVHPDCTVSPYTDEQELQALERLDMYLDGDREVEDEI